MADVSQTPQRQIPQGITVTVEPGLGTGAFDSVTKLLDNLSPSMRRSGKMPLAEVDHPRPFLSTASPSSENSSRSLTAQVFLQRRFAFETACLCVNEAHEIESAALQHALYFKADDYHVLREALALQGIGSCYYVMVCTAGVSVRSE